MWYTISVPAHSQP